MTLTHFWTLPLNTKSSRYKISRSPPSLLWAYPCTKSTRRARLNFPAQACRRQSSWWADIAWEHKRAIPIGELTHTGPMLSVVWVHALLDSEPAWLCVRNPV